MEKQEFLNHFEELIEVDQNSLNGSEELSGLSGWDSIGIVGFITMMDMHLDMTVDPQLIGECKTINDLASLFGDKIAQ